MLTDLKHRVRAWLRRDGPAQAHSPDVRDAGGGAMEATLRDVRYAVRQLRRTPAFAAVVIVSLALGIGANTAIFTLIDAVMLRPLPVARPAELQFLVRQQPDGIERNYTYDEFRRLQAANPVFAGMAAYATARLNLSVGGGIEPTAEGQLVSGTYFSVLGLEPSAGRLIGPDDDRHPRGHPVAVLSHGYWKRRFGLDPAAIGSTVALSGVPFTIIGSAPPGFFGLEVGRSADIFVPITMQPTVMPAAEDWLAPSINRSLWLTLFGRLGAERTPAQASALLGRLDVLDPLMTKPSMPGESPSRIPERLTVEAAATGLSSLRSQFSTPLWVVMVLVGVLLLIACANVATLVLARCAARTPEFSMRLALGASRWQVVRQLLIESVLLAAAGGLCGFALAPSATGLLVALVSSGRVPVVLDLNPDTRVMAFSAAVSLATGILCGLVPALRAGRVDVIAGLRPQRRGSHAVWLRSGRPLVAVQVSLCLVLLFGAGLFVRSLRLVDAGGAGFASDQTLSIRVEPRGSDQRGRPGTSERLDRIYRDLLSRVEAIPGVEAASLAHYAATTEVTYAEPARLPSGEVTPVARMMIYPRYFETMRLALMGGRDIDQRDLAPGAPRVAIVNQAFVRRVMSGATPLGVRLSERDGSLREIIGVVADSRFASLKSETPPLIYQPFLQTNTGRGQMTLQVRSAGDAASIASRVRDQVQRIEPNLPLAPLYTLEAEIEALLGRERLVATLSTVFGSLALLLAVVGLSGLLSFNVVRRRRELGVRLALGAARRDVIWLVMREALTLTAVGLAIGVPAALAAGWMSARWLSGLVYGVGVTDGVTMAAVAAVVVLVTTVAALVPAARAAAIEPMIALRTE